MCDWNSSVGRQLLSSGGRGHHPHAANGSFSSFFFYNLHFGGAEVPRAPLTLSSGSPQMPGGCVLASLGEAAGWSPREAQGTEHARSARPSKPLQSLHLPGRVTPSSCHRSHFIPCGADRQVEGALAL